MDISIVIRTYNEEKCIEQTLQKIRDQKTELKYEIIVIDSGSKDRTIELIKKFEVRLFHIKKEEFSFGKSLNLGAEKAKGNVLVFLSAHAIPRDNHWLNNLVKALRDPAIAGVYGRQLPLPDCNPITERDVLANFGTKRITQTRDPFFSNANAAIKRELWKKMKFDEKLSGSEDNKWARDMQSKKYEIVYEPKASVYHSHNETLIQIYNRTLRELKANKKTGNCRSLVIPTLGLGILIIKDILYILQTRNRHGLKWIFKSPMIRTMMCLASIKAMID